MIVVYRLCLGLINIQIGNLLHVCDPNFISQAVEKTPPIFLHCLQDKNLEWPGNKATNSYMVHTLSLYHTAFSGVSAKTSYNLVSFQAPCLASFHLQVEKASVSHVVQPSTCSRLGIDDSCLPLAGIFLHYSCCSQS